MNILTKFISAAQSTQCIIGIGIGDDLNQTRRIIKAISAFKSHSNATVILVGTVETTQKLKELNDQSDLALDYHSVLNPTDFLIHQVLSPSEFTTKSGFKANGFDVVVRGGLSSSNFVRLLRQYRNMVPNATTKEDYPSLTYRLALLETASGHQFFYAPVGIDECNTYRDKKQLIDQAIRFYKDLGEIPRIGLLSGGRKGDLGRDKWVDENIEQAENLAEVLQREYPELDIKHYEILIENAIQKGVNLLVAPEGIAGNLIYRTLIHLGAGKSYGAIYLTHLNLLNKIIIDTSRVAPEFELEGALNMGSGIFSLLKKVK
jgi:predicted methyltransferase MtxX (methanogen marker protein 4)